MQAIRSTTATPASASATDALESAAIDLQNLACTLTALSTSQGDRQELQAALCLTATVAERISEDLTRTSDQD